MVDHSVILARASSTHNPEPFWLHSEERSGHLLMLGTPTPNKSATMFNLMAQDIANGAGVAVIDVTGQYAGSLLDMVPNERTHSTYFFQPASAGRVVGYNPFQGVPEADRARVAQDIVELFKAIWSLDYDRTPLMLRLIRASVRVLLDYPDSTLLSMYALLTDDQYRARVVGHCDDPIATRFWHLFAQWDSRDRRDKPDPVLTRLEAFLSDPRLRNVLGQVKGALDLARVVDEGQVFIADVSRSQLGAETSRLFGCLLVKQLQSLLEVRKAGQPFYLYVPDAHLLHPTIAAHLMRSPIAHGGVLVSIDQVAGYQAEVRSGLLTAHTVVAFRLAADDVRYVEARFQIAQAKDQLPSLQPRQLAVSGFQYKLRTYNRLPGEYRSARSVKRRSKQALGVPRAQIERKISRFIKGLG